MTRSFKAYKYIRFNCTTQHDVVFQIVSCELKSKHYKMGDIFELLRILLHEWGGANHQLKLIQQKHEFLVGTVISRGHAVKKVLQPQNCETFQRTRRETFMSWNNSETSRGICVILEMPKAMSFYFTVQCHVILQLRSCYNLKTVGRSCRETKMKHQRAFVSFRKCACQKQWVSIWQCNVT